MTGDPPTISVIVPVLNGKATIDRCLKAIAASDTAILEVIVADDGSADGSGAIAERHQSRLLSVPDGPLGPGRARNSASALAAGDILVFVDADVAVEPSTIRLLVEPLLRDRNVVACVGSYDDRPSARNPTSMYTNLRHHFIHQKSRGSVPGFWAGCGAVRHEAFMAVGGFDSSFKRPSIEDIELGGRLTREGQTILLRPDAQAKHLKHWTPRSLWRTDIHQRAIPWARLMLDEAGVPASLNASPDQRVAAMAAILSVILTAASLMFGWPAALGAACCLVVWIGINLPFLELLTRKGGLAALIVGTALHFCYFLYSAAIFGWMLIQRRSVTLSSRLRST